MKIVYLTSGPRGAGKTTYTKKVISRSPEFAVVSRDELLVELFGSVSFDSYSNRHSVAKRIMMQRVQKHLDVKGNIRMILDCWNGFSSERRQIIHALKEAGADCVHCLYFVPPIEVCIRQCKSKEDYYWAHESNIRWDYNLFYRESANIEYDGFDRIIRIDPRQMFLPQIPIL